MIGAAFPTVTVAYAASVVCRDVVVWVAPVVAVVGRVGAADCPPNQRKS